VSNVTSVRKVLDSGYVQRYHTHPDLAGLQDLSQHQWRCAMIIITLHPKPSPALIREALTHDVGEAYTGDLPFQFKRDRPCLAMDMAEEERAYRREVWMSDMILSDKEELWLKFADLAECVGFAYRKKPDLLRKAEWKAMQQEVYQRGEALGIESRMIWAVMHA
jgi:hypothetical protein